MELEWTRNTIVWRNARSTPPPMQKKTDEIPSYTVPMVDTPCNVGACRFACGSSGTSGFFHPRRMRLSQHIIKHFPGVCPLAAAIFQQRVTRFLIRRCFIVVLLVKGRNAKLERLFIKVKRGVFFSCFLSRDVSRHRRA
jgi:hypothetical protein